MIKIIDTFSQIDSLFDHGTFNLKMWKEYINSIYDKASNIFEDDFSFSHVTNDLNERIIDCFDHELDIDIVLYIGLCNAAGWVTNINGRDVILLGVEKIVELNWCDNHFQQILTDFQSDLPVMTRFNQKYFGDWVNYCGRGDIGYYLGAKFVQYLCGKYGFEQLIKVGIDDISQEFFRFAVISH